jgi:tetratricopeptide (TPR) repeat protein
MSAAINYYQKATEGGYVSPEIYYRMGAAWYREDNWAKALDNFYQAYTLGLGAKGNIKGSAGNRRLLYALGNAAYQKGDNYAAQAYYQMLLKLLEGDLALADSTSSVSTTATDAYNLLATRLMVTRNNMAATLENLADRTGNAALSSQAQGLYALSSSAWDVLTRNPTTMVRAGSGDLSTPGINLAYLNSRNALYPQSGYQRQIYINIDKDMDDPSKWDSLAPTGGNLAGQL